MTVCESSPKITLVWFLPDQMTLKPIYAFDVRPIKPIFVVRVGSSDEGIRITVLLERNLREASANSTLWTVRKFNRKDDQHPYSGISYSFNHVIIITLFSFAFWMKLFDSSMNLWKILIMENAGASSRCCIRYRSGKRYGVWTTEKHI